MVLRAAVPHTGPKSLLPYSTKTKGRRQISISGPVSSRPTVMQTARRPDLVFLAAVLCLSAGHHLRLTRGPAGNRTTTGSLSASSRTTPYQLSHEDTFAQQIFFTHNWNLSCHCGVVVLFFSFLCGLFLLVFVFGVVFAFGSLCFGFCSLNVTRE